MKSPTSPQESVVLDIATGRPTSPASVARAMEMRRRAAASLKAGEDAASWLLDSPRLARVLTAARRIAGMPETPVMLQAERGTGAEELGRYIHDLDPRARKGRFLALSAHAVNAGQLRTLPLEDRTVLIEGVQQLRGETQGWLAGVVSKRIRGLRVIVVSPYDVSELLQQHALTPEFIETLDVARLTLPPLRERREEILPLAQRFLVHWSERAGRMFAGFSGAAEARLLAHAYHGNIRELRNLIERAVALEETHQIQASSIMFSEAFAEERIRSTGDATLSKVLAASGTGEKLPTLAELERAYLVLLVRELRGRRTRIARVMGLSYPTVLKKIARYEIDVETLLHEVEGGTEGRPGDLSVVPRTGEPA
jgi:DNA-binding NtrC family response regulator